MKIFKQMIVAACMSLPMLLSAQGIAVYDAQAVFNAMTEKAQAEEQLKQISDKLQEEFRAMQEEFNRKYADYQALAADPDTPASIKERRMQEIQESDKKIQAFQYNAEAELRDRRDQLAAPIHAAIKAAVQEVGDENAFDIILDISKGNVSYKGPNTPDVTQLVKAKLGL